MARSRRALRKTFRRTLAGGIESGNVVSARRVYQGRTEKEKYLTSLRFMTRIRSTGRSSVPFFAPPAWSCMKSKNPATMALRQIISRRDRHVRPDSCYQWLRVLCVPRRLTQRPIATISAGPAIQSTKSSQPCPKRQSSEKMRAAITRVSSQKSRVDRNGSFGRSLAPQIKHRCQGVTTGPFSSAHFGHRIAPPCPYFTALSQGT